MKPEVLKLKEPSKIKKVIPVQKIKQKKEVKKEITKVKILAKDDKFVVSNEIIPLKKPLNLGISKRKSSILSSKDFLIAQKTFSLIKRKRWNSAMKEVGKSRSKLLNELVTWMYLKEPSNNLAFRDYRRFINKNPEWPRINRLRYLAEHKINFKEVKPKEVIKFSINKIL